MAIKKPHVLIAVFLSLDFIFSDNKKKSLKATFFIYKVKSKLKHESS